MYLSGLFVGALQFSVNINQAVPYLKCGFRIFADDTKLYTFFNDQARSSLQHVIDLLTSTRSSWGLNINASKSAVKRFVPRYSSLLLTGQCLILSMSTIQTWMKSMIDP